MKRPVVKMENSNDKGRPLSNAETNSVKKEYIDKLMAQREAEAKKARQVRKQQAYKT
ncbi:DUF3811 domain-containing protein, partial [Klebsiella pneumoniae]|uniref:DUF3811 domain-containing protein n=1 Tax=Klebsiella pneumoniae TaxID=573 RepID=UPI003EE25167